VLSKIQEQFPCLQRLEDGVNLLGEGCDMITDSLKELLKELGTSYEEVIEKTEKNRHHIRPIH